MYEVYNADLEFQWSSKKLAEAQEYAAQHAEEYEYPYAVMLRVPIAGFHELRAVNVYDEQGRCTWETDVYQPELVPA